MTGKGYIASQSGRHFRLMFVGHIAWLITIALLCGWWGFLVLRQAHQITDLEGRVGISAQEISARLESTQRMVYWESTTLIFLAVLSSSWLLRLYWNEITRTRALQAFFASVTHELRTPLTSIRLQAESIADQLSGNESQGRVVKRLLEDTARLEDQVERTLELARVEGGGSVLLQPIQIKTFLERMIQQRQEAYADGSEILLQSEPLLIEADIAAIQVIFRNLIENSIRHSGIKPVRVKIETHETEDGIRVLISDNGKKFLGDRRVLGNIFEKGKDSQGAGVGLYLVSILMTKMGGSCQFIPSDQGFAVQLDFLKGSSDE
jgi:signal transduction histidine kinase